MATLDTLAQVDAELAATSGYDVEGDVSKAIRHAAALRRRLHFAQSSGRGKMNMAFFMQAIQDQLQQCLAWINANNTSQTDAQRLANPSVTHADFSTFRGYA